MTLNNHRFTTLSADDVAMCRAHSDAVANEPDHVVWHRLHGKSDAQLAAECERSHDIARFEIEVCMPDDLPLPDSYWDDLEHWLKTLAPAKPAAPALAAGCAHEWVRGIDLPLAERFGLWHYRADQWHKPGNVFDAIEIDDDGEYRRAAHGAKLGDRYDESKYATADLTARIASTSSADGAGLMHKVCIREHIGKYGGAWRVGDVVHVTYKMGDESAWLPSDEDGWIAHQHTHNSVCPVPAGLSAEVMTRGGMTCVLGDEGRSCQNLWRFEGSCTAFFGDFVAWRPIADDRK